MITEATEQTESKDKDTKELKWVVTADSSERAIYLDRIDFLTMLEELEFK